jgi:hypothetical protein
MKRFRVALLLFCPFAPAAIADAWKLSYRMPDGYSHQSVLELQVTGGTVAGKIASKRGSAPISSGRMNGNEIWFTVLRRGNGDELPVEFNGTIDEDTIKLRMQYRDHDPVEITGIKEVRK